MRKHRKKAVQRLSKAFDEIEALMVRKEPLTARRALDRMMTEGRGIVRRMQRMIFWTRPTAASQIFGRDLACRRADWAEQIR